MRSPWQTTLVTALFLSVSVPCQAAVVGDDGLIIAGDYTVSSSDDPLFGQEATITEMSSLFINGEAFLNAVFAEDSSFVQMDGGTVSDDDDGAFVTTGQANVSIRGGLISSRESNLVRTREDSTVRIDGGQFVLDTTQLAIQMRGMSVLNLFGGDFSQVTGQLLLVSEESVANVYGQNLSLDNNVLSGTLADGNSLNHSVAFLDQGQILLHQIPEPAAIHLLLFGILWVFFQRRQSYLHQ